MEKMINHENFPGLERTVRHINPELHYLDYLGKGAYGIVAKVARSEQFYALKIARGYMDPQIVKEEFETQSALHDIEGIPRAIELYDNAFLMQYIQGKTMYEAGKILSGKMPNDFFKKLRNIAHGIISKGYSLPADFGCTNIMIDRKLNPWVIDLMLSQKITEQQKPTFIKQANSELKYLEESYTRDY